MRNVKRCCRCGDDKLGNPGWWCGECDRVIWYLQQRYGLTMVQIAAGGECDPIPVSESLKFMGLSYNKRYLDDALVAKVRHWPASLTAAETRDLARSSIHAENCVKWKIPLGERSRDRMLPTNRRRRAAS